MPYLAGDEVSLADFLLLPTVVSADALSGADRFTDDLPRIGAWRARMAARPSFARALPS